MRYLSFLALALAIAITTALVGASGEHDPPHVSDGPPRFAVIHAVEPTTTSTLAYVLDSWVGVDYDEVQELAATIRSVETTTTTTTLPAPPTTKATPKPPATTPPAPSPTTTQAPAPSGGFNSSYESDFHSKINSLRGSSGLPGLTRSGDLNSMARAWAKWLGTTSDLVHARDPAILLSRGRSWAGETVGRGGSAHASFDRREASGGRRSTMLGGFTPVGSGVWVDGNGAVWAAHLFAGCAP